MQPAHCFRNAESRLALKKNPLSVPAAFLLAIVVASCGGGNSPGPSAAPTLSANVSALALIVSGNARKLIFTNIGGKTAVAVTYSISPALPPGTTISPASCGDIAAASSCTLTVTPGATPSASAGAPNLTPATLSIAGTNTNTLARTIDVVTYGSVYQSGYVFAIDDTKPSTGSIGGTVTALTDQSSAGLPWSPSVGSPFEIAGINETSTHPPDACTGNSDGACNSRAILAYYSPPTTNPAANPSLYAAGLCTSPIADYSDWYLPAICEMGYDTVPNGSGCGSAGSPTVQNMQSNLTDHGIGGLSAYYWSSTQASNFLPPNYAFISFFATGGGSAQYVFPKDFQFNVRCARALTF
jgi:hypothetical protein